MKLTIDTAAITHCVRRWLFRFFNTPRTMGRCCECGAALTTQEINFYGRTCERCEGVQQAELERADRKALMDLEREDDGDNAWFHDPDMGAR